MVMGIVAEAQSRREQAVWIAGSASIFFPPDAALAGIDLACLPVVWAPGLRKSLLSAEILLRSGSFGLIVVDIGEDCRVQDSALGRLVKLAEIHAAALIFLTMKSNGEQSIGSMISLRAVVGQSGRCYFESEIEVTKDKRDKPAGMRRTKYYGPPGMY